MERCHNCRNRHHGDRCQGPPCACRCRAMLGLNGPFEGGDPTAPSLFDQIVPAVEDPAVA